MKTSSAKAKGRKLLQWLKDRLLEKFVVLEPDDLIVTSAGDTGEDLKLSPKARRFFPFTIEGKSHARLSVYKFIEQAEQHHDEYPPLVIAKANRKEPLIIMYAQDFLDLIKV